LIRQRFQGYCCESDLATLVVESPFDKSTVEILTNNLTGWSNNAFLHNLIRQRFQGYYCQSDLATLVVESPFDKSTVEICTNNLTGWSNNVHFYIT